MTEGREFDCAVCEETKPYTLICTCAECSAEICEGCAEDGPMGVYCPEHLPEEATP